MPVVVCLNNSVAPAISFVGYEYGSNLGAVVIPGDTASGDTTYIFATGPSGNFDFATGAAPSGWTNITDSTTTRVYRRTWAGAPSSPVDIGGFGVGGGLIICASFRGVSSSTQEDATTTIATGSSGVFNPPAITTVSDNAWTIAMAFCAFDLNSLSIQPSGYENNIAIRDNTNGFGLCFCTKVKSLAGVEDPSSYQSFTASGSWRTATLALRPG
jgi:hypothetical protein